MKSNKVTLTPVTTSVDMGHSSRASWKGYFRIGDLMMPVRLFTATRSLTPRYVHLHADDNAPVRRLTVCSKDGEQLADGDIIRAVEYAGKYIEIDEDEIEQQSIVERDIVVRQITETLHIDTAYYDNPYYLVPDKGGELAYAILRRAFENTHKAAIATFIFYGRERLAAISSFDGLLRLQTLRFHEEILPSSDLKLPALPQPSPSQVSVASKLLDRYSMPFHASDYRDQQTDALNEIIERKARGLPLKPRARIPNDATPEKEVVTKIKQMLGEDPSTLRA